MLTAMSHKKHAMLCDVACRTNEAVVLEPTGAGCVVRDHVRQDQLSAARCTTHRHAHHAPTPRLVAYRSGSRSIAVICYAVDNARIIVLGRRRDWHAVRRTWTGRARHWARAPFRLKCNSAR